MDIGILGSGAVAQALGAGLLRHGYGVMLGTSQPAKLAEWAAEHPAARLGSFAEAASFGEVLILAVKGAAAAEALGRAGAENIAGKPVIDTTNPIADAPAENGVIKYFTDLDQSLMERTQAAFPQAKLVKAFNSVGNQHMVDPAFEGGRPTMFVCGNDPAAKEAVTQLLAGIGWEVADMGGAEAARAIEPLCMLWCIPGLLRGEWNHAFKLL